MKQIHYVIEAVLAVAIIILFIMMPRSSASKAKTTNCRHSAYSFRKDG